MPDHWVIYEVTTTFFFYFFNSFYLNIFHIVSKSTEAYHHGITIIITIFISFYSGSHTNTHNLNNAHELS